MKNFDDFLDSLSSEQLSTVQQKMNEAVKNSAKNYDGNMPQSEQIGVFALQGSIELLRLYHEWLNSEK